MDKTFANYSREIENFTIYDEPIEKINFNGKKFDVVFLLQVFEHISNPQNLLNQIKKCLNENGIIYIEVPNINDALYSIYNLESYVEFYFRLHMFTTILILHWKKCYLVVILKVKLGSIRIFLF